MSEFEQFLKSDRFNAIIEAVQDTDTTSREKAVAILMMARDIAMGVALSGKDDPTFGEGFRQLAHANENTAHILYHADCGMTMEVKQGEPPR